MISEIENAVDFLSNLLTARGVDGRQVDTFKQNLVNVLCTHYTDHWFPEKPVKGSGYRCLRICNNKMDPLITHAGSLCGMSVRELQSVLPSELTMWVDPKEVSYRIGEEGSIGVLGEGSGGADDDDSSSSSSGMSDSDESSQDIQSSQAFLGCNHDYMQYSGLSHNMNMMNMEYLTPQFVAS